MTGREKSRGGKGNGAWVLPLKAERVPGESWCLDAVEAAPCRISCPAGLDVKAYVGLIAAGKFAQALDAVKRRNPLPGICGRVCTHPCETDCARGEVDDPVAICALKRFVADWEVENIPRTSPADRPRLKAQVAVVGAGPAGLTVANHLARAGVGVTVFDRAPCAGGTLVSGIPEYRLPRDVIQREVGAIEDLGVTFELGVTIGTEGRTIDDLFARGFKAVFLGAGATQGLRLAVPGEDLGGVMDCLTFLRRVNFDGDLELTGRVLVVGGGNSAIDAARTALRVGAKDVTIVYRRTRAEMPANPEEIEEALEEGVKIEFLAAPVAIHGDEALDGVEFQRMELGEPDRSGRRRPVPVAGSKFTLAAQTVIAAIGQTVDPLVLTGRRGGRLKMTKWGTVSVDEATGAASGKGIFAGGDMVTGPSTVIWAIEAGHRAAAAILSFLGKEGIPEIGFSPGAELVLAPEGRPEPGERRVPARRRPGKKRVKDFEEVVKPLTEAQARAEARRCLRCGACAECVWCIPDCSKRLAEAFEGGVRKSIVRVDTQDGTLPFTDGKVPLSTKGGKSTEIELTLLIARVDETLCRACGECSLRCPYEAVSVRDGCARVDGALCKGCGLCAGACPTGAIAAPGFSDAQLLRSIRETSKS